jgi:hypothetical protein
VAVAVAASMSRLFLGVAHHPSLLKTRVEAQYCQFPHVFGLPRVEGGRYVGIQRHSVRVSQALRPPEPLQRVAVCHWVQSSVGGSLLVRVGKGPLSTQIVTTLHAERPPEPMHCVLVPCVWVAAHDTEFVPVRVGKGGRDVVGLVVGLGPGVGVALAGSSKSGGRPKGFGTQ